MKRFILGALLLCSSCYAQHMTLSEDSPWGYQQDGLQLEVAAESRQLARQGERIFQRMWGKNNATKTSWTLALTLRPAQSRLKYPEIFGKLTPEPRIRMEIRATGKLKTPSGQEKEYSWVAQGDTVPGQENTLQALLLERLASQIYQELGPRYVYR